MARLYSDLSSGGGRYYFALTSAPGGISPSPAVLTITGLQPFIFEQSTVFRTPATATLTLNGLSPTSDLILKPAQSALSIAGQIPDELRSLIITPAIPTPDYADLPDNAPTILFINTITPVTGLVSLQSLELNVTPGGNIGYITPGSGLLTLDTPGAITLIFFTVGVGEMSIVGQVPTLITQQLVEPQVGSMTVNGHEVSLGRSFTWVDVDPPPSVTWTTTTGVAA